MYWKSPADLVAALVKKALDLSATAAIQGIETTTFPFNGCAKQGGIESPWEWNTVMRHALDLCVDKRLKHGWGIDLPVVGRVTHAVWADNVYFVSHMPEDARTIVQEFTSVLNSFKLRWKPESLQYLTTAPDASAVMTIMQHAEELTVEYVTELEILGSMLSATGSSAPALKHRLAKAAACFWK